MKEIGESYDEVLFHCVVNLVFALGSRHHPRIEIQHGREQSDLFYTRAKLLLESNVNTTDATGIVLVQVLLLMSNYHQINGNLRAVWNCVSHAIRVGRLIGLDIASSEACLSPRGTTRLEVPRTNKDRNEADIRKRLWGGCLIVGRYVFALSQSVRFALSPRGAHDNDRSRYNITRP